MSLALKKDVTQNGYKQTELGLIPEDWGLKSFEEVFDFYSTATNSRADLSDDGEAYYIHYGDIHMRFHSHLNLATQKPSKIDLKKCNNATLIKNCDWIMADASEDYDGVGKSIEVLGVAENEKVVSGLHTFLMRERRPTFVQGFKGHLGNSIYLKMQYLRVMTGMKVFGVSKTALRNLLLPIPNEQEQEAIAEALSDADGLIEALSELIAKKRQIKQGAMQDLLTGKKRLAGFEGEWKNESLGELINSCSSGATPYRGNKEFYEGEINWITSGELNYKYIFNTLECITEDAVRKTNLKIHPANTFLIAITGLEAEGTRGSCGFAGVPSATNQSCMAIFTNTKLKTRYLYHYYVLNGNDFAYEFCQGTKQQSYTAKIIKLLPIYYPCEVEEQQSIVDILDDMDAEISTLETKLEKAKQIKQGMMQDLLSGKVRLI